ncbi:MAG: hypothetical protein ACFFDW_03355 [Candidatus Thorarchaeota archaeon]
MNNLDREKLVIQINLSENHNLLYFNIPKEILEKLELNETEQLEYDVRGTDFYIRKKGTNCKPAEIDYNIFEGLKVERTITKNNTILRTNLPKEVAQPLNINKEDKITLTLDGKVIIGTKYNTNR